MVPATFSASGLLSDLRRYGATYMNYVGKPLAYVLATPEQPDDTDNPLKVAFGNEASDRDIAEFSRRFDCTVWDGFGSSEGAIIITREDGCPPGSTRPRLPRSRDLQLRDPRRMPGGQFDDDGALTNADEAIGELVNTTGAGLFAGYYNDKDATDARLRNGMFWSGDLAYRDADGWIYFAGRSGDWLRVDGENMTTAPIERILQRLPAVSHVAVYAVPDEQVGDQVMAAVVLVDGAELTPAEFSAVSGRPARSFPQGLAAARVDYRQPAHHRHQQDPQTGAQRARQHPERRHVVDPGRPRDQLRRRRSSQPAGRAAAERPSAGPCGGNAHGARRRLGT